MPRKELSVELRQVTGKKVAQLRRDGLLPGNVYGHGVDSVSVQIHIDELQKTIHAAAANEVMDLKIAGERAARPVVIHKIQRHPLTSNPLHADFYQVSLREKMRADIPIIVTGRSDAIDTYNGVLVNAIETVHVEALPLDLPSSIEVDISVLKEHEAAIHVRDLPVSPNVTVLTDPDIVVMKIASPSVSTEEGEAPVTTAVGAEAPSSAADSDEEAAAE